jgi:predicted negative regulator of RcsB-dependent stress response
MSEKMLNINLQNKIINFLKKNLKNLIILSIFLTIILISYLFYRDIQQKNVIKLSEQYTQATIQFKEKKIEMAKQSMEKIINESHKFYSPLSLYFVINNNLEKDPSKIINYFDEILKINSIDKENLNLIKIKKAIFLFSIGDEELIIKTLNPVINSNSSWRNMAIILISDYFLSKDQKSKANEYIQLLNNKIKN